MYSQTNLDGSTNNMKASQRHVLDYLKAMAPEDVADINFTVAVTTLLQERTRTYRTNSMSQKLRNPVFQPTPAPKKVNGNTKKTTIAEREQKVAAWAKAYLKPYNIVRMNGTRDGHGLRLVIEVRGDQVVCQRFNKIAEAERIRFTPSSIVTVKENDGTKSLYVKTRDYSTHQLGKVESRFIRYSNSNELVSTSIYSIL